jgi:hypothetical protein
MVAGGAVDQLPQAVPVSSMDRSAMSWSAVPVERDLQAGLLVTGERNASDHARTPSAAANHGRLSGWR